VKAIGLLIILVIGGALALGSAPPFVSAQEQGDAARGERLFNRCKACHTLSEGPRKMGPHLQCLIGRTAGAVEGYRYSDAMIAAQFQWDRDTLEAYLRAPNNLVPGTRMSFAGIHNDQQLDDLVAYLEVATIESGCE
jgi:cytochrome c2